MDGPLWATVKELFDEASGLALLHDVTGTRKGYNSDMNMDELRELRIRCYRDRNGDWRFYLLGVDWLDCAAFESDYAMDDELFTALSSLAGFAAALEEIDAHRTLN